MKIRYVLFVISCFLAASNIAQALTLEERVYALENQQTVHEVSEQHIDTEPQFNFSGFGSFSASQLSEDATAPSGATNRASVKPHSLMGLQLDVELSPVTRVVGQLVSEGKEDFRVEVEWLFLEQKLLPSLSAKIGRFGYSVYSESRNSKVGYSYPTVYLNDEVYIRSIVGSIDGVSFDFDQRIGEWGATFNLYGGERKVYKSREMLKIDATGMYGVSVDVNNGPWDILLGWHAINKLNLTLYGVDNTPYVPGCANPADCPLMLEMKNKQWQLATKYQGGNWFVAYEASLLSGDELVVGDVFGQSFTLAYSIDVFQPYLQWGRYETKLSKNAPDYYDNGRHQQSLTFGLRHDFQTNIVLKYQAKYMYAFEGSNGLFNYYSNEPIDFDDAWAFDISLQFVFSDLL